MATQIKGQTAGEDNSVEAKRVRILEAATEVFATVGYNGADVQKIADSADVGKGTIYRYFSSKENLFWESGIYAFEFLAQAIDRTIHCDAGPLERLERVILAMGEVFVDHPYFVSVLMQVRFAKKWIPEKVDKYLEHTFFTPVLNLFQEAIDQKLIPPGDLFDYNISILDALWGVTVFHRISDDTRPLPDRLKFTFQILMDGLRVNPKNLLESPSVSGDSDSN